VPLQIFEPPAGQHDFESGSMRFWDEGRGRKTYLFRFWNVDEEDFKDIILRQTLDYYS
jgi:hypothetical protein